ncbi:MAG: phosphatase PAP2 family protein, partial [Parvibaculum sedimenti]|uniref:hypothetical protein n=1 Tax=Parvibaculum sedimenti TaxID=2608632 RepID=UPI003BB67628
QLARARWTRALFIAGALAGCGGIAASRILLHMHSAPEVLLGALIGLAAPIILYRVEPPASEPRPRPTLLLLLLPLCLVFILRGTTLPIESRIDQLSKALTAMLRICH